MLQIRLQANKLAILARIGKFGKPITCNVAILRYYMRCDCPFWARWSAVHALLRISFH